MKALGFTIRTNADNLRHLAAELGKREVEHVIAATDQAFADHTPAAGAPPRRGLRAPLPRRPAPRQHPARGRPAGAVRLHRVQRPPDRRSTCSTTSRSLVMDLWFRERREAANRAAERLPRRGGPLVPAGHLGRPGRCCRCSSRRGRACGPTSPACRATSRPPAPTWPRRAAHLEPPMPALTAIGGLSGTGKTTLARRDRRRRWAPAPGALVLRSDEVRKRLAGVAPTDKLPSEAYGPGTSERGLWRDVRHRPPRAGGRPQRGAGAVFLKPRKRARPIGARRRCVRPLPGRLAGGRGERAARAPGGANRRRFGRRPGGAGRAARARSRADWATGCDWTPAIWRRAERRILAA